MNVFLIEYFLNLPIDLWLKGNILYKLEWYNHGYFNKTSSYFVMPKLFFITPKLCNWIKKLKKKLMYNKNIAQLLKCNGSAVAAKTPNATEKYKAALLERATYIAALLTGATCIAALSPSLSLIHSYWLLCLITVKLWIFQMFHKVYSVCSCLGAG